MDVSWNFLKIVLQTDQPFAERQRMLVERFENADTFVREFRGTRYRYQLYDIEETAPDAEGRNAIVGRLTRSPKLARGRTLDNRTRQSEEGEVDVDTIADATEFIYDLRSCVLALHRRAPFMGLKTVAKIWSQLLGIPVEPTNPKSRTDVHVEILRDAAYVASMLDTNENFAEVRLKYARPNPGSGDDSLREITLGLIGEDVHADELTFNARRFGNASLDKSADGFIRRSITRLLENGYLKRGILHVGTRVINVLDAKEKTRETSGYERDEEDNPLTLRQQTSKWLRELLTNHDIYPPSTDD